MSDIFISYASEDRERVRPLAEALSRQGWSVWWDRDISTGSRFHRVIDEELAAARCVLVVWTNQSIESDWVIEEAQDGKDREILVPVLLDRVKPLRGFRLLQAVELLEWSGEESFPAFQKLLADLTKVLGAPSHPTAKAKAAPRRSKPQASRPTPESKVRAKESAGAIKLNRGEGLEYVWIPPGRFLMGAVPGDVEAGDHEKPQHPVEITKGFWLGRTPVTVEAYRRFVKAMGNRMPKAPDFNPKWRHGDHPIVNVSWEQGQKYCDWAGGRLPTEAEWEYAARGGKEGLIYPDGNELTDKDAKYASDGTSSVGAFPVNGFGLYDMAGNVWEWTADWYGPYGEVEEEDPQGPAKGDYRVLRGGSWINSDPWYLRCSLRLWSEPDYRDFNFGFRCVREVSP